MANDIKKFLDSAGTTHLWQKIKLELASKADASDLTTLAGRVTTLEGQVYDDTALAGRVTTAEGDIDALETTVGTLVGSDTNKSVRTIANEELAAQLIPQNAAEALDTLQEIAAWIQAHPGDAATMNAAIEALQDKLELGTYDNDGVQTEYATVKAYVEAALASVQSSAHSHTNKSVLDGIDATKVSNWDTAYTNTHTHSNKAVLDDITSALVTQWSSALQASEVIALTTAEIDAAIAAANQSNNGGGE